MNKPPKCFKMVRLVRVEIEDRGEPVSTQKLSLLSRFSQFCERKGIQPQTDNIFDKPGLYAADFTETSASQIQRWLTRQGVQQLL